MIFIYLFFLNTLLLWKMRKDHLSLTPVGVTPAHSSLMFNISFIHTHTPTESFSHPTFLHPFVYFSIASFLCLCVYFCLSKFHLFLLLFNILFILFLCSSFEEEVFWEWPVLCICAEFSGVSRNTLLIWQVYFSLLCSPGFVFFFSFFPPLIFSLQDGGTRGRRSAIEADLKMKK